MTNKPKSLVVLSGGQDSTTCAFMASVATQPVGAVFFDYGQKHKEAELECARNTAYHLDMHLFEIPLDGLNAVAQSALLARSEQSVSEQHPILQSLPASFVPGRNIVMLSLSASLAMTLNATQIWTGVCQTDYSGYPDCRDNTIKSLELSLRLGMDFNELQIVTPLMNLSKAETFKAAYDNSCLHWIIDNTHTGYNGHRERLWYWGWGPRKEEDMDPASIIRKAGMDGFVEILGVDRFDEWARKQNLPVFGGYLE